MNRIQPIDGLRAFAVTGVIWAHIWMFFGNLPLNVGGFDINRFLAFGGIGVDLFFVISGFCMYLMHSKLSSHFSLSSYGGFLKKRWWRIAPAFYFVVVFDALLYLSSTNIFPFKSVLYHLFFINIFEPHSVLSPPYWSLSTEWHFYMILPLLFIGDATGKSIGRRVAFLSVICMAFRLVLYYRWNPASGITPFADPIWFRFPEFGWGILACRFYLQQRTLPRLLRGNLGFLVTFAIAFSGRLCMTTNVIVHFGRLLFVVRALAEPILTLGFALMILNCIGSESLFRRVLVSRPVLFIGKISYSMYLWHWLIAYNFCAWYIARWGASAAGQEIAFVVSVLCCIPVAWLSYKYLEAPYFKRRKKEPLTPGENANIPAGVI